jgi:hypothetical protein
MNRFAAVALTLLISPVFSPAQNVNWQPPVPSAAHMNLSPTMAARLSYLNGACPVNLRAQQRGTGSIVTVDGTKREIARKFYLTFGNLQGKDVVGATITVYGYDATPRVMPAGSVPVHSAELSRTISLKLNVASGKSEGSEVTMHSFETVSRIDLESLDYADGTSWKARNDTACHVVPDGLILVGSR